MQSARNQALERAYERNATHLVWRHGDDSITPEVRGSPIGARDNEGARIRPGSYRGRP